MHEDYTASAWQARHATATGHPQIAREISTGKAVETHMYAPQHALALLEALIALEDSPALDDFLPMARAEVEGNSLLNLFCDRAQAMLEAAAGNRAAATTMGGAVAGFDDLGVPFERARTQELLATLATRTQARTLRAAALDTYERPGATPSADALRPQLFAG